MATHTKPTKLAVGQRYGRLVIFKTEPGRCGNTRCHVKCDCGNKRIILAGSLRSGATKSCGCLKKELLPKFWASRISHGMTNTPEYRSWNKMRDRCNNKNNHAYEGYGGRGITVCDRWQTFENFLADMGPRPKGLSLDRIDNNGNYEPSNCKWSTRKEQANNTRKSRKNNQIISQRLL